jgi:hypothetical protein
MRKLFGAFVAVAAIGWGIAGPGAASASPLPASGAGLTLPPYGYPGGPWYPRPRPPVYPPFPWPQPPSYPPSPRPPAPPYPSPRPPEVRLAYSVQFRTSPRAPWREYGRYSSASRAQAAAARLQSHGYETEVVVRY